MGTGKRKQRGRGEDTRKTGFEVVAQGPSLADGLNDSSQEDVEDDGLAQMKAYARLLARGDKPLKTRKRIRGDGGGQGKQNSGQTQRLGPVTGKNQAWPPRQAWPPAPQDSNGCAEAVENIVDDSTSKKEKRKKKTSTNALRRAQQDASVDLRLWKKFDFGNQLFEAYYRKQNLLHTTPEWEEMLECLRSPLPVTFRLHEHDPLAECYMELLTSDHFVLGQQASNEDSNERAVEVGGQRLEYIVEPAFCIPEARAWQVGTHREGLRRGSRTVPQLADLAELLRTGCREGVLARQELVSMLPVLALDCRRGHRVLDMCASPGSKTMQLLEKVTGPREDPFGEDVPLSEALVVANDANPQRAALLNDTVSRHNRSAIERGALVVSCNYGEELPIPLFRNAASGATHEGYDRVLADVPCSGDGTIRKAADILRRWTPEVANQLHSIQLEIGLRGIALLAVGGTMVYSTCSLNPAENESVVAEILRRCNEEVEESVSLLDMSDVLPSLDRSPGLSAWHIAGLDEFDSRHRATAKVNIAAPADPYGADEADGVQLRWYSSSEEAVKYGMRHACKSLFPPANAQSLKLERCLRILPHQNDTGGFFVAAFVKHKAVRPTSAKLESVSTIHGVLSKGQSPIQFLEPLRTCAKAINVLRKQWGMPLAVASESSLLQRLWMDGGGMPKLRSHGTLPERIYLSPSGLSADTSMKVVAAGLNAFRLESIDGEWCYAMHNDAVPRLCTAIERGIVSVSAKEMKTMLQRRLERLENASDTGPVGADLLAEEASEKTRAVFDKCPQGPLVLRARLSVSARDRGVALQLPDRVVAGWKTTSGLKIDPSATARQLSDLFHRL
eukprot:scaffold2113_cov393-Prasinococcus_capsulatus_cf.AAC.4